MFREFEFAPECDRLSDKHTSILANRLSDPAFKKLDVARVVAGFYAVRIATGKPVDALFFSTAREAAVMSGKLQEAEVYDLLTTLPKDGYGKYIPINKIAKEVQVLKESGKNVGLKFGHYRRFTPYQIFELTAVKKACDYLVLVIESGIRTKTFKEKRIELTDEQRIDMIKRSCLVDAVSITTGMDYSNEYYRELVAKIKPTTLFISGSWPVEVQEEYKLRAKMSGADSFIVPSVVTQLTTSNLEQYTFFPGSLGL